MNNKVILKSEDLKVKRIMYEEVNKIATMMIKDCRLMIGLHRITMAQKLEKKKQIRDTK